MVSAHPLPSTSRRAPAALVQMAAGQEERQVPHLCKHPEGLPGTCRQTG